MTGIAETAERSSLGHALPCKNLATSTRKGVLVQVQSAAKVSWYLATTYQNSAPANY